jgi:hypothetical protein
MASITWNVSAGDGSGLGLAVSGLIKADAMLTGSGEVAAGASATLALQIENVTRVALLIVTCNRYDGSVSIKGAATADAAMALDGPVVAFGAAAARIASSLETMTITAKASPDKPAIVNFLVGTRLT